MSTADSAVCLYAVRIKVTKYYFLSLPLVIEIRTPPALRQLLPEDYLDRLRKRAEGDNGDNQLKH